MDQAFLARGRAFAVEQMVDTFEVKIITGHSDPDPVTGEQTTEYDVLFTSKGKIQDGGPGDANSHHGRAGDVTVASVKPSWQCPITAPLAPRNSIVECTAVGEGSDPANIGRQLRLLTPAPKTFATSRRYEVQDIL